MKGIAKAAAGASIALSCIAAGPNSNTNPSYQPSGNPYQSSGSPYQSYVAAPAPGLVPANAMPVSGPVMMMGAEATMPPGSYIVPYEAAPAAPASGMANAPGVFPGFVPAPVEAARYPAAAPTDPGFAVASQEPLPIAQSGMSPQAPPFAASPQGVYPAAQQATQPSEQSADEVEGASCPRCGLPGCPGCGVFSDLCDFFAVGWDNARNGPQSPNSLAGAGYGNGPTGYMGMASTTSPDGSGYLGANSPNLSSGLGGTQGGTNAAPPPVIGDQLIGGIPNPPPPSSPRNNNFPAQIRTLKIAENQSPRPVDRVYGSFNFYYNVNQSYNNRIGSPGLGRILAYRQLYGFEKTIFNGQASIGFFDTINTVTVPQKLQYSNLNSSFGGTHTAQGSLNVYTKMVLLSDPTYSKLISGGFLFGLPTGPATFGGYAHAVGFRQTTIQPYLGYLWSQNRFYFQGFSSINIATDTNDATVIYNDLAVGYYLYNSQQPQSSFITSIVPTYEVHVNTPVNHAGWHQDQIASTPHVVDFTFGTTFVLKQRTYLTLAYVTPVTGPRPFDFELAALLNFRFGGLFQRNANSNTSAGSASSVNPAPPTSTF